MPLRYEGQDLYRADELEAATGVPSLYLASLDFATHRPGYFTPASIVGSFGTSKKENRHKVAPPDAWQAAHPALAAYLTNPDPFDFTAAPDALAALEADGHPADAPLTDEQLRALLGSELFERRHRLFREAAFYTPEQVEGIRERHAKDRAETEKRAAERTARKEREAKAERGRTSPAGRLLS